MRTQKVNKRPLPSKPKEAYLEKLQSKGAVTFFGTKPHLHNLLTFLRKYEPKLAWKTETRYDRNDQAVFLITNP